MLFLIVYSLELDRCVVRFVVCLVMGWFVVLESGRGVRAYLLGRRVVDFNVRFREGLVVGGYMDIFLGSV